MLSHYYESEAQGGFGQGLLDDKHLSHKACAQNGLHESPPEWKTQTRYFGAAFRAGPSPRSPPGPRPASPPHLAPAHCGNPAEQFVRPRGIMSPGVHSHHALIPDTHPNFFFFKKLPLIFFSPFSLFPRLSSLTFLPSSFSLFISFFLFTHKRIAFPTMCSFLKNG